MKGLRRKYLTDIMHPSLEEFMANIGVTSYDLEPRLTPKLYAAIRSAEKHISKIVALSEFTLEADLQPKLALQTPLLAVESVKVDGVALNVSDYTISKDSIAFDESVSGSIVEVVYTAGMVEPDADIVMAILLIATDLWTNPSDTVRTLASNSENLLRPYRTYGL